MRYIRILFILPLLAALGCDDDGISVNPVEPAALVRFINAAPQPGAVDLRFIDRVESLPRFLEVGFREHSGAGYDRVIPGTRHLRVFPNNTDPTVAQTRLVDDPNFALSANARYTLLLTQEGGSHVLTRFDDPAVIQRAPSGQIAVQVLHAATGDENVNVYVVAQPVPADWRTNNAHVFRSVGYRTVTGHVNVPALSSGLYTFIVTNPVAAGNDADADVWFFASPNQPGAASTIPTVGPQPGVRIEQSVLTVVLTPGDGIVMMIDRTLDPD
jgi:hypothetical protein